MLKNTTVHIPSGDVRIGEIFGNLGLNVVSNHKLRTKDELEWFKIRRYVDARLSSECRIESGRIEKSESPDFIHTGFSGFATGIEVAQATNRESQLGFQRDEEQEEEFFFDDSFALSGDPNLEWAKTVGALIESKATKIKKAHWQNLDAQEVLVYPNLYRWWADDRRSLFFLEEYIRHFEIDLTDKNGERIVVSILFGHRLLFDVFGDQKSLFVQG